MGPSEKYVRAFTEQRQARADGWNELEQAIVGTLIGWKVECEMRPTSGDGSDCSDLMNVALGRLIGLIQGDLTAAQLLDDLDPERRPEGGNDE